VFSIKFLTAFTLSPSVRLLLKHNAAYPFSKGRPRLFKTPIATMPLSRSSLTNRAELESQEPGFLHFMDGCRRTGPFRNFSMQGLVVARSSKGRVSHRSFVSYEQSLMPNSKKTNFMLFTGSKELDEQEPFQSLYPKSPVGRRLPFSIFSHSSAPHFRSCLMSRARACTRGAQLHALHRRRSTA
jgi:hypothetical protein